MIFRVLKAMAKPLIFVGKGVITAMAVDYTRKGIEKGVKLTEKEMLLDVSKCDEAVFYLYSKGAFVVCHKAQYVVGEGGPYVINTAYTRCLEAGKYDPESSTGEMAFGTPQGFDQYLRADAQEKGATVITATVTHTKIFEEGWQD